MSKSHPSLPIRQTGHGDPNRNAGDFTRGSQLIGHQFSMWLRGARVPPMIWLGTFLLVLWLKLIVILDDHEVQMIAMRALAWVWDFINFDEMKRVNVTLKSGHVYPTYMGYVPYIAEVQIAWEKMGKAFWGSLLFATVIAIPFSIWFIMWSNARGRQMLEEHHERGVEIVEADELVHMIEVHNTKQLRRLAAEEYPRLSYPEVMDIPFERRKRVGLVPSYKFGTLPFPFGHEQTHQMIIGTTGAGKTTAMRALVSQAVERGDSCVIFDLTGHYMEAFYKEGRDHVLNLNDARCRNWSIFNDCDTQSEFVSAATALIPGDHGNDGGFWERAARSLFVEMCVKLRQEGLTTNKALSDELLSATLTRIHARLKDTVAGPFTSPDVARMAQSIRAVLNSHGEALRFLPTKGKPFSIRQWIKDENKKGSILFITAQYAHLDMCRAILTLWMNIAINTMMTLKHTRQLRTWFMFDELGALHQLPSLTRGLQTARSFGGAFVLGVHSFAGLRQVYGEDGARNIISLTGSKLIMRTSDRDTAEELSKIIGYRKVRTVDEAYSYGAHATRDASTLSATTKEEALVIADDITSLSNLHAFIRFPEHFPSTYVKIPYVSYPSIAEGFIEAAPPEPILLRSTDDTTDEEAPSQEGDGRDMMATTDMDAGKDEPQPESKEPRNERPEDKPPVAKDDQPAPTSEQSSQDPLQTKTPDETPQTTPQQRSEPTMPGPRQILSNPKPPADPSEPTEQTREPGQERKPHSDRQREIEAKDQPEESNTAKHIRRELQTDQGREEDENEQEHTRQSRDHSPNEPPKDHGVDDDLEPDM